MLHCMPKHSDATTPQGAVKRARRVGSKLQSDAGDLRVASFPPQMGNDCRLLILGTVPSLRSLAERQSYAHPQNLFWRFMGEMFDAGFDRPYAERIARLHARGIGIWDVLKQCERRGSLDSNIVVASEIGNDIPGLLTQYPSIAAIALNGSKAQQAFRRHVLPELKRNGSRVTLIELPSTSPANASISVEAKRERWHLLQDWARN
ncbi:MAG: DNA-deoxyinosine glycosylase [Dokdonella sp.]